MKPALPKGVTIRRKKRSLLVYLNGEMRGMVIRSETIWKATEYDFTEAVGRFTKLYYAVLWASGAEIEAIH